MAKRKRQAGMGHVGDDAEAMLRLAKEEIKTGALDQRRRAAEWASLALDSALECARGKAITSGRAQREALSLAARRIDRGFARRFAATRRMLHGDCFHQRVCDRFDLLVELGKAENMIAQLLRVRLG